MGGVLLLPKNQLPSPGKAVIHGIASVGHSSDTETESSADETPARGHKHGQRRMRTRRERTEKSSHASRNSKNSNGPDNAASQEARDEEATEQNQKESKEAIEQAQSAKCCSEAPKAAQKVMQPRQEAGIQDSFDDFLSYGLSVIERKFM